MNTANMTDNIRAEVRGVFDAAFPREPRKWTNWFFDNVFDPADALVSYVPTETDGDVPASALMLLPYTFGYQGQRLGMSYVFGAGTLPRFRGRGLMHGLMIDALEKARGRGDAVCALVPANRRLYFFYDKFGFRTVFYSQEERYTSLHRFAPPCMYDIVEADYETLHRLEKELPAGVLHTSRQYQDMLRDLELDNGIALAVRTIPDGHSAILFARPTEGGVTVHLALADDQTAYECALEALRKRVGERTIIVRRPPVGSPIYRLRARGMLRIVNAGMLLKVLAAGHPSLRMTLRLRDEILDDNDGVFVIADGGCTRREVGEHRGRYDLDVSVSVLAEILFSAPRTGEIFNLPTIRPTLAMMLD